MKTAIYARVSSDEQAERNTIAMQLDALRARVDDITSEYLDEGVSGTISLPDRPGGAKLLADARAGKFKAVAVYRLDRLGRSLRAIIDAHDALEKLGVAIRSVTEPFDTSEVFGRAMFGFLAVIAEMERGTIIERTSGGRRRVAREGKWTGGRVPYGYLVEHGFLVPSERVVEQVGITESELVRSIFERVADGETLQAIVRWLNASGIPSTPDGDGLWRVGRVSKMLHNPLYLGRWEYQTKVERIVRNVPALVDLDTAQRAHAQLTKNMALHRGTRDNWLRGKIKCENCGSVYVCAPVTASRYYYRCCSYLGNPKLRCHAAYLNADRIEALVWDEAAEMIEHPEMLIQLGVDTLMNLEEKDRNRTVEIRKLQSRLGEKALARDMILRQVRKGHLPEAEANVHLAEIRAEEQVDFIKVCRVSWPDDLSPCDGGVYAQL